MKPLVACVLAFAAFFGAAGCKSAAPDTAPPESPAIQWDAYPPGLQDRIQQAVGAGDCTYLRKVRRTYTNVSNIPDGPVGNGDLLWLIDSSAGQAGCGSTGN